jgi:hypothetical protein
MNCDAYYEKLQSKGKRYSCTCTFLTKHHAMEEYWGKGGIAPHILDLGTRWRWMVSFTPQLLYPPQEKTTWYLLDRRLGGPQNQSGHSSEEKNSQPLLRLKPPIVQSVAQHYTTELSQLPLRKVTQMKNSSMMNNMNTVYTTHT